MKLLDAQISLPSCLVLLGSHHTEHTLVKILQRKMQIIPSKSLTTHSSKKQYTVIITQPSENLGNKLASQIRHSNTVCLHS